MKKLIIAISLLSTACAPNYVKMGVFYNKATLITADGSMYTGKIFLNYSTRDGEIEFTTSPYGELKGNWSSQSQSYDASSSGVGAATDGRNTVIVPAVGSNSVKSNNGLGRACLANNNKLALRCNMSVDFIRDKTGLGGFFVIGNGVCIDNDNKQSEIQFTK